MSSSSTPALLVKLKNFLYVVLVLTRWLSLQPKSGIVTISSVGLDSDGVGEGLIIKVNDK